MNEYIVLHEVRIKAPPEDSGREDVHRVWAGSPEDAARTVASAYEKMAQSIQGTGRVIGVFLGKPELNRALTRLGTMPERFKAEELEAGERLEGTLRKYLRTLTPSITNTDGPDVYGRWTHQEYAERTRAETELKAFIREALPLVIAARRAQGNL